MEDFIYTLSLKEMGNIIILGSILCFITVYATEFIKKKLAEIIVKHTWVITALSVLFSFVFAIGYKYSFAENMPLAYAVWLGFFLTLGSYGFYEKLKTSTGFFGRYFNSVDTYVNTNLVTEVLAKAEKEAAQIEESKK